MKNVLSAFAGHVPAGLKRVYPHANITLSPTWAHFTDPYRVWLLDPFDPIFQKIGYPTLFFMLHFYMKLMRFFYCITHKQIFLSIKLVTFYFYNSTAFIDAQTRVYGTDHIYNADTFNELDPPSADPTYLAAASNAVYQVRDS